MELESTLVFPAEHPAFAGHFPGAPIVAGVLLLDAAVHALEEGSGAAVTEIASAKFLRPVGPGELLALACRIDGPRAQFQITSGSERAAVGQLLMDPTR